MVIDKLESKTIDILRMPCAVLVVFIHVFSIYPGYGGGIFRVLLSQGIARVAVPVFFLTSGYLFFNDIKKWSWSLYGNKISKRIKTLVLPYLLWNTIFIIWFCLTLYASNGDLFTEIIEKRGSILMYWNCNRFDYNPSINILGWQMWNGAFPINYPLWFIRDLIVISFFSPLVFIFIKRLLAISLLFILYLFDIWIPIEGFRAEGFFFFALGGYLMYNNKGIVSTFSTSQKLIYSLAVVSLILSTFFYGTDCHIYFRRLVCFFGSLSLFQIAAWMVKSNEVISNKLSNPFLIEASFIVYAAHAIGFKPYICAGIKMMLGNSTPTLVYDFVFFVTPFIICLVILFLYALLRLLSPRLCSVLTGGRIK